MVSFKLAKLLKEKGFDEVTGKYWAKINQSDLEVVLNKDWMIHKWNSLNKPIWSAPTIAEVVMWLYEKHDIWIWVERCSTQFRPYAEEIGDERFGKWEGHKYNSPTEAYEAAITFIVEKHL